MPTTIQGARGAVNEDLMSSARVFQGMDHSSARGSNGSPCLRSILFSDTIHAVARGKA